MEELWKPVPGYEGLYEVSDWGRVRSLGMWTNIRCGYKRWLAGRVLRSGKDTNGYLFVVLNKDGVRKHYKVHRLVGMTFPDLVEWTEDAKGRPFEELEINHKDENKENNCVNNLEWCSRVYNNNYGTRNEKVSKSLTNGKLSKTVYQYTLDGQLVRVWPSTMECGRNGFSFGCVAACCRGQRSNHKGFRWSYNPPA